MFVATAICFVLSAGPPADISHERSYGQHDFLAYSETQEARESSGIAPSHFDPEVFWTCNDSGRQPRLYAFRLSLADRRRHLAADLGYLELRGGQCIDWEDLAPGPGNTLYVFDGGNNPPCGRADKRILRITEPEMDWAGGPVRRLIPWDSIRFEYPDPARPGQPARKNDDRYDAECLLVHPVSGDMYVVTKRDNHGQATARLYRLPVASVHWNSRSVHVLEFMADLSKVVPSMVTGGAVAPDSRRIILRNYLAAYEFTLPEGRPFETIFQEKPQIVYLLGEPQGEGICYASNGDLLTTSEAILKGSKFPIFTVPVTTRPASEPSP